MAVNVIIPKLGMTMKEAKLAKWFYKEGDQVEEGDVVAEIETEKITHEIEAPISGILAKIVVDEGEVATVSQVIAIMIKAGESFDEAVSPAPSPAPPVDEKTEAGGPGVSTDAASEPAEKGRIKSTPIARKIAKEHGLNVSGVKGTGPGGRITKEDVLKAVARAEEKKAPGKAVEKEADIRFGSSIPLTRMREIIGERLSSSSRDVPHVYFSSEVDGTGLMGFRNAFMKVIESETGVRLSFNDVILKAVAATIEKYPLFNAVLEGKTIKVLEEVNIGLAVSVPEGLIVPVLRKVNEMTLGQLAAGRAEILDKAQNKKLNLDDLSGGTFTVSNLGQFNIDFFTSIINPPETGILSVAKMKERAVVVDGEIIIRPTMYLGLSADHRVVDGAMAAAFLQDLQGILENPFVMCKV